MSDFDKTLSKQSARGLYMTYLTGFILSAALTLLAYVLAVNKMLGDATWLVIALVGLALVQFLVQLFFFLHLGQEIKPRWKRLTLFLMIIFAFIVIAGSMWVMWSLNKRMMPMSRQQINSYMREQVENGL